METKKPIISRMDEVASMLGVKLYEKFDIVDAENDAMIERDVYFNKEGLTTKVMPKNVHLPYLLNGKHIAKIKMLNEEEKAFLKMVIHSLAFKVNAIRVTENENGYRDVYLFEIGKQTTIIKNVLYSFSRFKNDKIYALEFIGLNVKKSGV